MARIEQAEAVTNNVRPSAGCARAERPEVQEERWPRLRCSRCRYQRAPGTGHRGRLGRRVCALPRAVGRGDGVSSGTSARCLSMCRTRRCRSAASFLCIFFRSSSVSWSAFEPIRFRSATACARALSTPRRHAGLPFFEMGPAITCTPFRARRGRSASSLCPLASGRCPGLVPCRRLAGTVRAHGREVLRVVRNPFVPAALAPDDHEGLLVDRHAGARITDLYLCLLNEYHYTR